jgi:hypothetical protein
MSTPNQLQTIDLAALSQVSGGTAGPATPTGATNDQIITALSGILDSIKSLAGQPNAGGFNQQEMLMMMMIMNQRNQQQAASPWPWTQEPIVRYY